jgi:hypothetical protein
VRALEHRYGTCLPHAYRDFLLARNGGRPERDLFRVPGCMANPVARVHFFFGINDPVESCNLAWNIDVFEERLPRGMIPVGTTEGADKICLALDSGAIVYWDGYEDVVFPVSGSFEDFMASLFSDELSPHVPPTSSD